MSDIKYSRRELIQLGGFSGLSLYSGMDSLVEMILKSFVRRAIAEETGQQEHQPTNYINVGLLGAPLRYQFDHWIRTNANDPESKLTLITGSKLNFSNGKLSGADHGYFNHNGVLVPHLYTQNVNTSNGSKPLSDLLKHMTVIRGYQTGLDGHPTNHVRQMAPVGGLPSMTGLAADYSHRIFDAIQWPNRGGYNAFNSAKSKSINILNVGTHPAQALLEGFSKPPDNLIKARSLSERNKDAVDLAKRRLAFYINADLPGSKVLAKNHSNAIALIKKGTDNLEAFWIPSVNRYHNLISEAMRTLNIPGISDSPLLFDNTGNWNNHFADLGDAKRSDLFWKVGSGTAWPIHLDFDFRQAVAKTYHNYLAEGLALCEYILSEQLGAALEIHFGTIPLDFRMAGTDAVQTFNFDNDMHETGAVAAIFLMNQYYRGLGAGILELIEQLKAKKIGTTDVWSKTVIQFSSEFSRSARAAGNGSDHGFNQMVTSALAGAVKNGPHVVGNIYQTPASGTQGVAAPIANYTMKDAPSPVMAASTVAELMQVDHNPYENLAAPLCEFENGVLNVKYPGKMIEGG